jgi:hypothetical protein
MMERNSKINERTRRGWKKKIMKNEGIKGIYYQLF